MEELRLRIFDKYKGRCAYCGCQLEDRFALDHIIPANRGIKGHASFKDETNLNPSCYTCNSSKSNKSIIEWKQSIVDKANSFANLHPSNKVLLKHGLISVTSKINDFKFYFETYE